MRAAPFLAVLLLSLPIGFSQETQSGGSSPSRTLSTLLREDWEYQLRESPTFASFWGDKRYNDRWDDLSLDAFARRDRHARELLAALQKIDPAGLGPAEQLNLRLFRQQVERRVEEFPFGWYLIALTQREGIQTEDQTADMLRFDTVKDYEDWLARLRSFPVYMDQTMALMREGMRRRVLLPKVLMERVPAQIRTQLSTTAQDSPFYRPFRKMPASIPAAEQDRLRSEAFRLISSTVQPSYQKLLTFFSSEYLPASFDQTGVWQIPNGDRYYALLVKRFTTTGQTPQQIHEKGLQEVARIRAEMETLKAKVGFSGTLTQFFDHLRKDERFYYKTPEELFTAYAAMAKRIDPLLVRVFKTLPRTPYGVEAIPAAAAPDTTTAYYRPPAADGSRAGTYFVNLYRPETRPRYEMMALTLHESVPGHHLQIAIGQELGTLPDFRRASDVTAFVEGWGLYAESLGDDLGLYEDPYAKFGQLTYEMWRAVRLVVDTGMHAYHWDRQKAIDYFLANAAKTELDVVNEVDRYQAMPGQALAYKIGELKIKELREESRKALGSRFDLREFHDVVLGQGALPLNILEENVKAWIARLQAESKGQKPDGRIQ